MRSNPYDPDADHDPTPAASSDAWLVALRAAMHTHPDVAAARGGVVDVLADGWHRVINAGANGVVLIRALARAELDRLSAAADNRSAARGADTSTHMLEDGP